MEKDTTINLQSRNGRPLPGFPEGTATPRPDWLIVPVLLLALLLPSLLRADDSNWSESTIDDRNGYGEYNSLSDNAFNDNAFRENLFSENAYRDYGESGETGLYGDSGQQIAEGTGRLAAEFYPAMVLRGQSNNSSYWNTVYNPYATTYVAQADTAASTQPVLTSPPVSGTVATPSTGVATSAPPVYGGTGIALDPATSGSSGTFTEPVQQVMKFWHNLSAEYVYIPRGGGSGLGINEFNFFTEFSFPCSLLQQSKQNSGFWYVAPGFSLNLWSTPRDWPKDYMDMPSSTFDANLAFGVRPQLTDEFGIEAWVQVGLASSFKKIKGKAFYVRGRATAILSITDDGRFQATGGVLYLDREHYKLLPVAGVIWKPNERNVWRLVFPDPRLSHYLGKWSETDWWGYVQGNIGGGRWLLDNGGDVFNCDYNDYRVGLGLSFSTPKSITGSLEFGGSFARELYSDGIKWYKPKNAIYLKAGLNF